MTQTVDMLLQAGARALAPRSDSARLDAELLLGTLLGASRSGLIARGREEVSPDRVRAFAELIDLRLSGAPVAYLTGVREFWSMALRVSPDVLVPRPETELLVELSLARLPADRPSAALDLGTGSGAIALALAHERPLARIVGVDLSAPALEVARRNSRELGLPRIEWRRGSWFEAVPTERFEVIAANPPYVACGDAALQSLDAEPALALSPGPTGLEALAAIVEGAPGHLSTGGWLLLEHGQSQAPAVRELLGGRGFDAIETHDDLSGKPRVTLGRLASSNHEENP